MLNILEINSIIDKLFHGRNAIRIDELPKFAQAVEQKVRENIGKKLDDFMKE
jgi:hypothetical protein